MHLSYRGTAQPSTLSGAGPRRSSWLRQGQQLAQQMTEASAQAVVLGTRSARKVASLSRNMDMTTLLQSSATVKALKNPALEAEYHSLERSLQLAYAVGDRGLIAALESEIEQLTGWRFNRRR